MEKNLVIKDFKAKFQDRGESPIGYMKFTINNKYIIKNIVPFSIYELISKTFDDNVNETIKFMDIIIYTNLFEEYHFESIKFEDDEQHKEIIIDEFIRILEK